MGKICKQRILLDELTRKHLLQRRRLKRLRREENKLNERLCKLRKQLKIRPNRVRIIDNCFRSFRKLFGESSVRSAEAAIPFQNVDTFDKVARRIRKYLLSSDTEDIIMRFYKLCAKELMCRPAQLAYRKYSFPTFNMDKMPPKHLEFVGEALSMDKMDNWQRKAEAEKKAQAIPLVKEKPKKRARMEEWVAARSTHTHSQDEVDPSSSKSALKTGLGGRGTETRIAAKTEAKTEPKTETKTEAETGDQRKMKKLAEKTHYEEKNEEKYEEKNEEKNEENLSSSNLDLALNGKQTDSVDKLLRSRLSWKPSTPGRSKSALDLLPNRDAKLTSSKVRLKNDRSQHDGAHRRGSTGLLGVKYDEGPQNARKSLRPARIRKTNSNYIVPGTHQRKRNEFSNWFDVILKHKHPKFFADIAKIPSSEAGKANDKSKSDKISPAVNKTMEWDASEAVLHADILELDKMYRDSMEQRKSTPYTNRIFQAREKAKERNFTVGELLLARLTSDYNDRFGELIELLKDTIGGPTIIDQLVDQKSIVDTIARSSTWTELGEVYQQLKAVNLPKAMIQGMLKEQYLINVRKIFKNAVQLGAQIVQSDAELAAVGSFDDSIFNERKRHDESQSRLRREQQSRMSAYMVANHGSNDSIMSIKCDNNLAIVSLENMLNSNAHKYSEQFLQGLLEAHSRFFGKSALSAKDEEDELAILDMSASKKKPKKRRPNRVKRLFYAPRRTCRQRKADAAECVDCECEGKTSPGKCIYCADPLQSLPASQPAAELVPVADATPSAAASCRKLGLTEAELEACVRNPQVLQAAADICDMCGLVHRPGTLCPTVLQAAGDGAILRQQLHLIKHHAWQRRQEQQRQEWQEWQDRQEMAGWCEVAAAAAAAAAAAGCGK